MCGFFQRLEQWDISASLWINGLHTPLTDSIWLFFSSRTAWVPLYLILAGVLFWKLGWKRALTMILLTIVGVALTDQFGNLVKDSVCRLRPCADPRVISNGLHILSPLHPNYLYGFFSAHAANSMCFAVCILMSFKLYVREHPKKVKIWRAGGILMLFWALLVGLSRVFVAKHFLGDVLVGFLVGALIGYAVCRFGYWFIGKYIKA